MDHPPAPIATALRLFRPLLAVLALVALVLGSAGAGVAWLLGSEAGTRWLLARAPGLDVQGWHGALASGPIAADRVRVSWAGGASSVTIAGLAGDGLVWRWRPEAHAWLGLDVARLTARSVVVVVEGAAAAPARGPATPPAALVLPLRISVAALAVDELQVGTLAPLRRIAGRVAIGDAGAHHVDDVSLEWDRLRLHGSARIAAAPPFAIDGRIEAAPADDAFGATLRATGSLERLQLDATLRSQPRPGRAAPAADVHATLLPFAAWPVAELSAQTEALDLSALLSGAPETRLSGRVQVQTSAADAPIGAAAQIDNALAGRWDEGRLPVRRLLLDLQGRAASRDRLELTSFDVTLGSASQAAGRWSGRGQWLGHDVELETTLAAVRPQSLDGRAAALTLSGPLAFKLSGAPSPDPAAAAPAPPWTIELRSTLDGRIDAAPQPVKLTLDAVADAQHVEVKQLRAESGAAVASLRATAERRGGAGDWQLASEGTLAQFDPLPWWPGRAGSPWRQGPHHLNATWKLDVRVPAGAERLAPLAMLPRLVGSGRLQVHDSELAGVPLALDLSLAQSPSNAATPGSLRGELHLGGNTLAFDGQGDPTGNGASDEARLTLDAPTLATLAPIVRLDADTAAWAPRGGSANAKLSVHGRWPRLRTDGDAELAKIELGTVAIGEGKASWHIDIGGEADQPLQATAELSGIRVGNQRAEQLHAELSGTLRSHKLRLEGVLPLAPPPAAELWLGVRSLSGTRAQVQAEGSWQPDAGGGGRWRGHVTRLDVAAWDAGTRIAPAVATAASDAATNAPVSAASAPVAASSAPVAAASATAAAPGASAPAGTNPRGSWVEASDLTAELQFDGHGELVRVQADAGRMKVADAVALHWDAVDIDLHGSAPDITLRAQIEPFAAAPLLARLQPTFGWRGDLQLAASIDIRAAERFDADVVIERRGGDLLLVDETGTQTLGLTELRLALAAHDGAWTVTPRIAGRTMGELGGELRVKATPAQRWPAPDSPLEGRIDLRVDDLGVWGTWVPPGWRLVGRLDTRAAIGGRFGAPEYTGEVRGHGLGVRNLLEGVNISQGEVAIKLEGSGAQIERFTLKGGDGTLTVAGGAQFGATPNANLHLVAERFRVLGRIDRQLSASGSADLALQSDELKLDGKLKIDDGLFDTSRGGAPSLDDDVSVRHAGDAEKATEAAAPPRPKRNVAVNIDVDLGTNLRVRGRGLDTELRGLLHITTPNGRLAVSGTVSTANGTYAAYGQKLDIDRGIVAFSGSVDNPRLDILALRPNTDMRVGVSITGNLLTPRVRLYSETDMSDTDKLSWLVLGRAPDGLGRTDTMLLQRAAVALLAGEGESPTDTLIHTLGLDEISLKSSDTDVHSTVVSVGKQLSRRWYIGYERGVNATTGTFQLIYRVAQRITLRAQSGSENSLDIIWTWKFDEVPLPAPRPAASAP